MPVRRNGPSGVSLVAPRHGMSEVSEVSEV